MKNHNLPTSTPLSFPEASPDADEADDILAFADRIREMYRSAETIGDHFRDLASQGKFNELSEAIDAQIDEMLKTDADFCAAKKELEQARRWQDESAIAAAKARLREIESQYRMVLIAENGLPDKERFSEIEQARRGIHERLTEAFPAGATPAEALKELGFITVENDTKHYHFPAELLPESTNNLWEAYLAAVCKHVQTERDLRTGVIDDKNEVMQADSSRTYAHNAVTREVHSILSLDESWSQLDTRQLLAHIRDDALPTYESAVSPASKAFVDAHSSHLRIISALASRNH